jgi:hypothetical protein
MNIIFSRKGFDSGSGGCPSPILPDGRLFSLPIPADPASIAYQQISWGNYNAGEIVASVTGGKTQADDRAHLDPDLNPGSLKRLPGWRPLFGQAGAAQGHLRNQAVGPGDLFLFFGLFQEAVVVNGRVRLNPKAPRRHIIWGWLQVGEVWPVAQVDREQYPWAVYHPHLQRTPEKNDTIYIAKECLDLPGLETAGAGVFTHFQPKLQLTAPGAAVSVWRLPSWLHPEGRESTLTYHGNSALWTKEEAYTQLRTVGRGQEFVLNAAHYPEAIGWVKDLLTGWGVTAASSSVVKNGYKNAAV